MTPLVEAPPPVDPGDEWAAWMDAVEPGDRCRVWWSELWWDGEVVKVEPELEVRIREGACAWVCWPDWTEIKPPRGDGCAA